MTTSHIFDDRPDRQRGDRAIEVIAVLLLGLATIGSAWCGYQASQWNGSESRLAQESSNARVEASRLYTVAAQTLAYDSSTVSDYAQAVVHDDQGLIEFYRAAIIRPAFLPQLDEWAARIEAGEPVTNLLEDQDYLDGLLAPYNAAEAHVEAAADASLEAGRHGDDFILAALLLAAALFLAGVTTSFRVRGPRLLLLVGAFLLTIYTGGRLTDIPVH